MFSSTQRCYHSKFVAREGTAFHHRSLLSHNLLSLRVLSIRGFVFFSFSCDSFSLDFLLFCFLVLISLFVFLRNIHSSIEILKRNILEYSYPPSQHFFVTKAFSHLFLSRRKVALLCQSVIFGGLTLREAKNT